MTQAPKIPKRKFPKPTIDLKYAIKLSGPNSGAGREDLREINVEKYIYLRYNDPKSKNDSLMAIENTQTNPFLVNAIVYENNGKKFIKKESITIKKQIPQLIIGLKAKVISEEEFKTLTS